MNKRKIGGLYEDRAAAYLRGEGMEILVRNFRCHLGEIDLIARDGEELVFVEVKYRYNNACGAGEFHVDRRKQQTISRVAEVFLTRYFQSFTPYCRFDVVSISGTGEVKHIVNAFEKNVKRRGL